MPIIFLWGELGMDSNCYEEIFPQKGKSKYDSKITKEHEINAAMISPRGFLDGQIGGGVV